MHTNEVRCQKLLPLHLVDAACANWKIGAREVQIYSLNKTSPRERKELERGRGWKVKTWAQKRRNGRTWALFQFRIWWIVVAIQKRKVGDMNTISTLFFYLVWKQVWKHWHSFSIPPLVHSSDMHLTMTFFSKLLSSILNRWP